MRLRGNRQDLAAIPTLLGPMKGPPPMTHRPKIAIRNLMLALLALDLMLLVPAVAFPDATVRRVLFAVVLLASIGLLLSFIFVVWAMLEQIREDVDENEAVMWERLKQLRARLDAHIALCDAHHEDAKMDSELAKLFGGQQRSA